MPNNVSLESTVEKRIASKTKQLQPSVIW